MTKPFDENHIRGLTDEEAAKRISLHGYNELPVTKKRSGIHIGLDIAQDHRPDR
jgi:hypothetical protein